MEIPDSITSIIISRIDKLPKEQKEVIQLCSVLGMDFDLSILYYLVKEINKVEFDNFTDIVNSISDCGILIKVDKSHYSFSSSLYRDVVYEMQLKSRLSKLHGLTGNILEKLYKKEESYHYDIASHFYLAGNKQKSISYFFSAGNHFKLQYKNLEALDCCEKILKLNPGMKIKNNMLYLRAYINFIQGNWENSNKDLIYLIDQPDQPELKIILDAKNLLSQIYLYQEKVEDALKIAISGLNQARINKFDVKMDNFKTNIGQIYFRQNKYDEAMNIYREIINKHENDGNSEFVSIALGNIGLIYWNRGAFDQAVNCYRKQIDISIKNKDKFGLSVAYLNLGSVLFHRNQIEKAMEYFAKTKQICEQIGYKRVLSSAVGNMGAVYVDRGDINRAFECFNIKKKISVDLGDRRGLSVAVGNLGTIYMEIGNYEFALECLNQKKQISQELSDQRSSVYAEMYIGDLHRRKEDYDLAIENYKKAFSIAENINLKIGLVEISAKMGLIYALNGEYLKSLQMTKNSLLMEKELKTKGYTYYYAIGICLANLNPDEKIIEKVTSITGMGGNPDIYFQHSLKEMKRETENIEYANFLIQYAKYLDSKGCKTQSKKYLDQSRKICKTIQSTKLDTG
ncbi:MAG: tetratricopeptide repeat protein [bacterium]